MANNEEYLIPTNQRSKEEASELGRQGGVKSGEVRRAKKNLRQALEILLEKGYKNAKGDEISGSELLALKQFEKAVKGDTKAFEVIRDTSGQKPIDKVMIAEVEQGVIDEVEGIINENNDK